MSAVNRQDFVGVVAGASGRCDRWRDFQYRPRICLYRYGFHEPMPQARSAAVYGPGGGRVPRQRRLRGILLYPRVLSRHHFATKAQAREVNHCLVLRVLQHPTSAQFSPMLPPVEYEKITANQRGPHKGSLHVSRKAHSGLQLSDCRRSCGRLDSSVSQRSCLGAHHQPHRRSSR
jgi:hypothetical protein